MHSACTAVHALCTRNSCRCQICQYSLFLRKNAIEHCDETAVGNERSEETRAAELDPEGEVKLGVPGGLEPVREVCVPEGHEPVTVIEVKPGVPEDLDLVKLDVPEEENCQEQECSARYDVYLGAKKWVISNKEDLL